MERSVPIIERNGRDQSRTAFPTGIVVDLSVKCQQNANFFHIDADWSPIEWNGNFIPGVIEVRIDGLILVMKTGFEVVFVVLIHLDL